MKDRVRSAGLAAVLLSLLAVAACAGPEPGIERGEAVYDTCTPCHGSAGQGNQSLGAPAIAGLPRWYIIEQIGAFDAGWRGGHPMDTVGIRMRSMARALDREGDLESVADHVTSLPRITPQPTLGGDPRAGELVYTTVCQGCHLPDASGFEGSFAPPLVGQHDWYMLSQYQKYVRGWRGADEADIWGVSMGQSTPRATEAEVIDALAYIGTLPTGGSQ